MRPHLTSNIIVDTREKSDRAIGAVRAAWRQLWGGGLVELGLGESGGDWGLEAADPDGSGRTHADPFARVESKWLGERGPVDLFGSVTSQRDRLKRELAHLAAAHPCSLFLAEGKASDFRSHATQGGMVWDGQVDHACLVLAAQFRVPWLWTDHAAHYLAVFLGICRDLSDADIQRAPAGEPRRVVLAMTPADLSRVMATSRGPGAQYFCRFAAPSPANSPNAPALIMRHVATLGAGFWFLDGYSTDEVDAFARRFEDAERRASGLAAAGGIPRTPPSYAGEATRIDAWKPMNSPRKRRGLVIVFSDAGDRPLLLLTEKRSVGAAFTVFDPRGGDITLYSAPDDTQTLPVVGRVEDAVRPERDLIPEVLKVCRAHWSGTAPVAVTSSLPAQEASCAPTLTPTETPALTAPSVHAAPAEEPAPAVSPLASPTPEPAPITSEPPPATPEPIAPVVEAPAHRVDDPSSPADLIRAIERLTIALYDTAAPTPDDADDGDEDITMAAPQPRKSISYKALTKKLSGGAQGFYVLLLGAAKVGKSRTAASVYAEAAPGRALWITAGELDGWRTAESYVGRPLDGIDISADLRHPQEMRDLLTSLEDGAMQTVVLDSLDGLGRWVERFLVDASPGQRTDKDSRISRLDKQGYGLRLSFTLEICERLYRVALKGTNVVVTCGVRPSEVGDRSAFMPDLPGQAPLIAPRMFSDVGIVVRGERGARELWFEGQSFCDVAGSRSGMPGTMRPDDLGGELFARLGEVGAPETVPEAAPEPITVDGSDNAEAAEDGGVDDSAAALAESLAEPASTLAESLAEKPDIDEDDATHRRGLISRRFIATNLPLTLQDGLAQEFGAAGWDTWAPEGIALDMAIGIVLVLGTVAQRIGLDMALEWAQGLGDGEAPILPSCASEERPAIPLQADQGEEFAAQYTRALESMADQCGLRDGGKLELFQARACASELIERITDTAPVPF